MHQLFVFYEHIPKTWTTRYRAIGIRLSPPPRRNTGLSSRSCCCITPQFFIHRTDAAANRLDHIDGHTIPGLFVRLGVRGNSKDFVDLAVLEALQAQALPRHGPTDASAALYNTLCAAGFQRMRNIAANPAALERGCKAQVYGISRRCRLISDPGVLANQQHTGSLRFVVG